METENLKQKIWDPIGEDIFESKFEEDKIKLNAKFESYQKNPYIPKRNLLLLGIPVFLEIGLLIFHPEILGFLADSDDGDGLGLLFIPFLPVITYIGKIFLLQRDLVKIMIAKENNWVYSPSERSSRWMALKKKYPEFFEKGNESQNLQDEFWGKFQNTRQAIDFWSGVFQFKIVKRGSKGRQSRQNYFKTVFALKLNKTLKSDFRLKPETAFSNFFSKFRKNEINTEFADFNRSFGVYYNGEKMEKEQEIVKILSPAVQIQLIELKKQDSEFEIIFREDSVIFMFEGKLLKKMKTNFFRKVEVQEADKATIQKRLHTMLSISTEIVPFLD